MKFSNMVIIFLWRFSSKVGETKFVIMICNNFYKKLLSYLSSTSSIFHTGKTALFTGYKCILDNLSQLQKQPKIYIITIFLNFCLLKRSSVVLNILWHFLVVRLYLHLSSNAFNNHSGKILNKNIPSFDAYLKFSFFLTLFLDIYDGFVWILQKIK